MIDLKQCQNKRFTVWLQWSDSVLFLSPRARRLTEKSSALQPSVHWDHETRGSMLLKGRRQIYSPNLSTHVNMHNAFQSPLIYTQARHSGPNTNTVGCRNRFVCKVQEVIRYWRAACCGGDAGHPAATHANQTDVQLGAACTATCLDHQERWIQCLQGCTARKPAATDREEEKRVNRGVRKREAAVGGRRGSGLCNLCGWQE